MMSSTITRDSSMQGSTPQTSTTCPHGLRPGTTVCLRCLQEARQAARQRRYKLAARVGLFAIGGAVVVGLIVGAIMAVAPDGAANGSRVTEPVMGGASAPATPATDSIAPPKLAPIIPEGRRELGDSMYAVRDGDDVTVNFDTELLRTRYDWKFEGIVRATLPMVFGPAARVAFDSIPEGTWVRGGNILTDLPTRGILLDVDGESIRVWPITRAGRDGPLVVAYRAAAGR